MSASLIFVVFSHGQACMTRVPFVDVMATMNDPTIPLTVVEYEEWGNPGEKVSEPNDESKYNANSLIL